MAIIEEKNPLKQGLKLCCDCSKTAELLIEEKNPLKQGLKHNTDFDEAGFAGLLKRRIH